MAKRYRRYDPRLRNLVAETRDIDRFRLLGIPRSTLREWVANGPQEFFTLPELSMTSSELLEDNLLLKAKLSAVQVEQELVSRTIRIFGFQIQYKRLPSHDSKSEILLAIKIAMQSISLQVCLNAIGLSAARYFHWLKRQVACHLEDQFSCPRVSPTKLTGREVSKIKNLYTNNEFAHYSVTSLNWFGRKTGEVVDSASTWSRVIREFGLKRNHVRLYPPKPKVGIRAMMPGQIWHLDLTILRLQDGSKAFVQAIRDNFSRYVLALKVSTDFDGLRAKKLLLEAIGEAGRLGATNVPEVLVDSGTENLNRHVDELVESDLIRRVVAQIDIEQSNSMIERLFQRLKHNYLFNIPLTNFEALERGCDYYLTQSNLVIPHSALGGATPFETFTGAWTSEVIAGMREGVVKARVARMESNRSVRCMPCIA